MGGILMNHIIGTLQAIRQLLVYLISGLLICLNPYLLYLFTQVKKLRKAYYSWLLIDRLICTIAHNTFKRTISGWSGQWAEQGVKRYVIQAKVIDFLAYKFSGEVGHCKHAYEWELKNGWVE
jgi:hypothetical protein